MKGEKSGDDDKLLGLQRLPIKLDVIETCKGRFRKDSHVLIFKGKERALILVDF